MRQHKLWLCTLLVLLLAALGAFGAAAETTVGMSGAGSFKMEQVYVNVPELDVYFYALDGDGNSYSPIKVQAAGPELTLGDRRLEVRSVAAASDPICYILALDNSKSIAPSEFYTMLGGVRKLINAMGDDDQLMLYTTAGSTECVLPATSDKNLMYKTLGSIKQVEGSMDTARLISAVYSELQSDYQALAPRKAAMIVTDAGQVLTNMALFATLASDVSDQIGMAAYIYLMTDRPGAFETLESAADGRLVLCEASTLGDELKKKQEYFATALEIKTEVPESLYGERLETLTLAMPQLGSAIRSSQTVYMGYRLAKPQVTKVETLRRDKLRLTFNQPINENANKPQLYEVRSKDIWNWRVQVKSVTISEDARTADLEIEPRGKDGLDVTFSLENSGVCKGKETVQLYVRQRHSPVVRPQKELKGFEKVQLAPGETKTVTMELDKRSFAWYNTELHDWYAASGKYEILIGASSRDIRLSETIELSSSQVIPMHIHMNTTLGELFNNPDTKEAAKE